MKILFLGDYSNLHATLAEEIRRRGHSATVISDGGRYMRTHADILLCREPGITGTISYLSRLASILPRLRGFDVVQLINPNFIKLRPKRLQYIFRYLLRHNGEVNLTLCGNDAYFVTAATEGTLLPYTEFAVGTRPTPFAIENPQFIAGWTSPEQMRLHEEVYRRISRATAVLPEYHTVARTIIPDKLNYAGIPINLENHTFSPINPTTPIKIAVAIRRETAPQKGTLILRDIALSLSHDHPDLCSVEILENLPLKTYLERISRCAIVLDQLYAYTPATNALNTLAQGRIPASGASEMHYYNFIGEPSLRPIIPIAPDADNAATLLSYLRNPGRLRSMSREGRALVEKYNDVRHLAPIFIPGI